MTDRLPIHNLEAERGALSCIMLDGNLAPRLDPSLFYDIRHQELARVLVEMHRTGKSLTLSAVGSHLSGKAESIGGLGYLAEIHDASSSAAAFDSFEEDLEAAALKRRQAATASKLLSDAQDPTKDANEAQEAAEREIIAIRRRAKDERKTRAEIFTGILEECEWAKKHPGQVKGFMTGFRELDWSLMGMRPGQLIVIGARPGEGKTSLMMNIAQHNAVEAKVPVGVISLEMSERELFTRMLCSAANISGKDLRTGRLDTGGERRLLAQSSALSRTPIHIVSKGCHTLPRIEGITRKLIAEEGIRMLVVDYLQLIQPSGKTRSRYEAVCEVSGALKQLAMQLDLPVIVGSQLNRDTEKEGRVPRLSDLRDSGSIEQDADVVVFIHHPQEDSDHTDRAELLVAKNRAGDTGKVVVRFDRPTTTFKEIGR